MERNGSKLILCPWLEGNVLEKAHERQMRREELTNIMRKKYAKLKYKHIPARLIDWWMDKEYMQPFLSIRDLMVKLLGKVVCPIIEKIEEKYGENLERLDEMYVVDIIYKKWYKFVSQISCIHC